MNILETIIIAIVEGLTEFLPVSSTGHMIITQHLLGMEIDDFVKMFTVVIQFGAILSVVVLYYKRFFKLNSLESFQEEKDKGSFSKKLRRFLYRYDFYWKLFVAFIPAAVLGALFDSVIDQLLGSVTVVAIMLVVGGVFMICADYWFVKTDADQSITEKKAFKIGLAQCVAMIPGVSRSMATIVGGMSQRLTRKTAAEFSFFLAVPTMLAATAYKLLKMFLSPEGVTALQQGWDVLLLGNIVAFLVAIFAIKFFIRFISTHGFKWFGYYRIVVGILLLIMMNFSL